MGISEILDFCFFPKILNENINFSSKINQSNMNIYVCDTCGRYLWQIFVADTCGRYLWYEVGEWAPSFPSRSTQFPCGSSSQCPSPACVHICTYDTHTHTYTNSIHVSQPFPIELWSSSSLQMGRESRVFLCCFKQITSAGIHPIMGLTTL